MTASRIPALGLLALLAAGVPLPLPAAAQAQPPDETIYLEKVNKDFLDRVRKCEEGRDWKGLFDHYNFALKRHAQSVVQVSPDRWTSVHEYFLGRISKLPREAFDYYRFENDGKARAAFEKARESGSRRDVERAVEEFFFATGTDEVLDGLASQAFDEGRVEEARTWWSRLLRLYPDTRLSRAVIAARIANACVVSENAAGLTELRRIIAQAKILGEISVAGKPVEVREFVAQLALPARSSSARPPKMPYVPEVEDRLRRPTLGIRNDIRRWVYDFNEDRGETAAEPAPEQQKGMPGRVFRGGRMFRADMQAPPPNPEFPLVPAFSRVRGKDYVIFTDGSRLLAVDPSRVKGKSTTSGVYWKYPSEKPIPRPQAAPNQMYGRPSIGVTIDGEYAFATMYSGPEARPRDANAQNNNPDQFEGVTAVKCLHIPTGKLVWDTDLPPLLDEVKTVCKDFYDRNFSFSAPPLVKGDRLYLGICTSPMGEQESRVLCLDRKTGRPLWTTFLSSVTGVQAAFMGVAFQPTYLPMLAEQGGTLYVETNLGVVGALNPASGAVLWLVQYRRAARHPQSNGVEPPFIRPASPPVLWNGTLFVLAQDRADLMAFDAASGDEIKLPRDIEIHSELAWKSVLRLLGPVNDDLLITGSGKTFELRLRDENGPCFRANALIAAASRGTGRGVIADDYAYLPVADEGDGNQVGGLGVYDVRTWKIVERPAWKEANEGGNLLVAGSYLVVATNRISIYTDVETLRNQYARRLGQSPPNADLLFEYGETMRENDRLEDAAEAYLSFIHAVDGDARQLERARDVRRELHSIFLKRGDEAAKRGSDFGLKAAEAGRRAKDAAREREEAEKKGDENAKALAESRHKDLEAEQRYTEAVQKSESEKALECFRFAKEFAWDRASETEAVQRLAGTYENLGLWKEAVAQYQELVQKGRSMFHRETDSVTKLWDYASRRIDDIVGKVPGAYGEVEKQAGDALEKVRDGSVEGLREVMDRFPNSKAAREAFGKMRDTLLKQGQLDKLRALYGDFQDRFKLRLNFDAYKELLELLEKLGDLERFKFELGRFGERFGDSKIGPEGQEETVKVYVVRRLEELARRPAAAVALQGPLRLVGELDAVQLSSDPQGVALGHLPLCPLGVEPVGFAAERELFRRGSTVELWDLKAKRRIWACAHPGAWLGAMYGDAPQGVAVLFVKPGSPAEKAGLKKDDLLMSIDGRALRAAGAGETFGGLTPGTTVDLLCRRGASDLKIRVALAPMPAELRPAILGAAFTREGALAVAWDDLLAAIDLATGAVEWTFRVSRDRFHFSAFHATDGRLYLYESIRADRASDPMRMPLPMAVQPPKTADANHLLFCLSDFTGDVLWARKFDFQPDNPTQETKIEFLGKYFVDYVTFLHMTSRAGQMEWSVWLIPAQGGGKAEGGPLREAQRRPLLGQKMAHAVDAETGVFYYATDIAERRERMLYSINLDPARQNFKPVEIRLHDAKYMPYNFNYTTCSLAASRDFFALIVSPSQQGVDHRIWVWKTADLKDRSLAMLPGRTLPVGRPAGFGIGPDDLLYVYNLPRDRSLAQTGGRAYLTAFNLKAPPGQDPILWDAKAPVINDTATATMVHGAGTFEILTAPRAAQTGEVSENPAVVVYDRKAEGYVRMDRTDLALPADAPGETRPSALYWRGRLYVTSLKALEVYGD